MNYAKTALLLVALTAILMWIGGLIGGSSGVMIAFIIALAMNGISYWYSDKIVLKMYNARLLDREFSPEIYRTVEELSNNAGIPCPKIFMTDIDAPNAFATGRDPENAALCLTKGLLGILDEREVRGVISHELGHVKNRDTLIMTITASLASAIMMVAYMARWAAILGGFDRDREGGGNIFGLIAISIVAPLAAMMVQLAISRSREYAADKRGAQISHDPGSLARALEDLSNAAQRRPFKAPPQTAHLFIVKPFSRDFMANLFSTHPPTEERVRRLREMDQ